MLNDRGLVVGPAVLRIGTFRHAVSQAIPALARAALIADHPEGVMDTRNFNKKQFMYNLSRAEYESQAGEGTLQLTNNDGDTGHATCRGEYALGDATCARLAEELFKRGFARVPPDVRASLLAFYDSPPPPKTTRKAQQALRRTACEIEVLRSGPGSAAEAALRERLLRPAPRLP